MSHIEQTGKTVEEATQLALEQLGVTEDEVDVEILDEGSKGFLGLGSTPAKVRVTLKKVTPAPRAEVSEQRPPRQRQRPRPKPKPKTEVTMEPEQKPEAAQPRTEEKREPRQQRRERKPETRPAPTPESQVKPEGAAPAAEAAPAITEEMLNQAAEIGREVLQKILDGIGVGGTAVIKSTGDTRVSLEIADGDTAVLIGRHGQTIDALQYLVGDITNKQLGIRVRLTIDAESYRTRREEALRNQAIFLAGKVKESGQEAVLEPLPASERRIVHSALADDAEVYTYSEGQEPERYVVISPKK